MWKEKQAIIQKCKSMKYIKNLLFIFLVLSAITYFHSTSPHSDEISLADLDFLQDAAEEQNAFEELHVEPPSPFMIKLREWGTPLFMAFCSLHLKIKQAWQWTNEKTYNTCIRS